MTWFEPLVRRQTGEGGVYRVGESTVQTSTYDLLTEAFCSSEKGGSRFVDEGYEPKFDGFLTSGHGSGSLAPAEGSADGGQSMVVRSAEGRGGAPGAKTGEPPDPTGRRG